MQEEQVHVAQEVQEERINFRLVEDLQEVGINMSEINKLKEAGYPTIGTVLQQPHKVLINIKGFSEGELRAFHILNICMNIVLICFSLLSSFYPYILSPSSSS